MIKNYQLLFLLFGIYLPGNLIAQNNSKNELYNQFDAVIGVENTSFYNGIAYNEFHKIDSSQDKFLFSSGMLSGEIVYDGQTYFDVLMNYSIYDDLVLVKLENNKVTHTFQLLREKVESFKIKNLEFVRIIGNSKKNIVTGMYEVLVVKKEPQIRLLKKHRLLEKVNLSKGEVSVYTYKMRDSDFVLDNFGELILVENKRDFQAVFPEHKNKISNFYRDYRSLRKSNPDEFMTNLVNFLITKN